MARTSYITCLQRWNLLIIIIKKKAYNFFTSGSNNPWGQHPHRPLTKFLVSNSFFPGTSFGSEFSGLNILGQVLYFITYLIPIWYSRVTHRIPDCVRYPIRYFGWLTFFYLEGGGGGGFQTSCIEVFDKIFMKNISCPQRVRAKEQPKVKKIKIKVYPLRM